MNSILGLFLINQPEMTFLKVNLKLILQIIFVSIFVLMILHPLEDGGRCLG